MRLETWTAAELATALKEDSLWRGETDPISKSRAHAQALNPRASKEDVFSHLDGGKPNLVDVRSPAEFTGEIIAPPGMNETAQRGGHIPGASSIPWAQAVQEDGTFKTHDDLKTLYEGKGLDLGVNTIAYCRIGERSSHSWFVLKYLLGVDNCKNYDGSWTEWGNLVGAPIEKP